MLSRGWEVNSIKFQFYLPQTFGGMLGNAVQSKRKIIKFYTEGSATLVSIIKLWGSIFQHVRDCPSHFTVFHKFWEEPRVWKSTSVGPGWDVKDTVSCTIWYAIWYWSYWYWWWKTVQFELMTNSHGKITTQDSPTAQSCFCLLLSIVVDHS